MVGASRYLWKPREFPGGYEAAVARKFLPSWLVDPAMVFVPIVVRIVKKNCWQLTKQDAWYCSTC